MPKYFIDYIKKIRECGSCFELLSFDAFRKTKRGFPYTWCIKCKNKYNHQNQQEKLRDKNPDLYLQCLNEDCNYIWKKKWGKIRLHCPHCKSLGE